MTVDQNVDASKTQGKTEHTRFALFDSPGGGEPWIVTAGDDGSPHLNSRVVCVCHDPSRPMLEELIRRANLWADGVDKGGAA